ncbi:NAD(P)/FAD-dependent oxidoreductase [Oleiharenicola lentus]|uniref:NAD(P)/FAD-dependent oxidoreductase n=1 Tax=Oleiharenicola lentus TaxID=2508720 RepID=UPI003F66E5BC
MSKRQVIVVGGGAAGYFAAIACAETNPDCVVTIYEATAHLLAKVKVSGGGRCNVTHACFDPRELVKRYPRGGRELLGAFHRWQPRDTVDWFAQRGVELKTEEDGRMFPVTDSSQTIVDCLQTAAAKAGVTVKTHCGVKLVERVYNKKIDPSVTDETEAARATFRVTLVSGEVVHCDKLMLATGGNKTNTGFEIARQFGHVIEPPVPSLFTFNITDPRLTELAGVSVEEATTAVRGTNLKERGPLLVTHWGLSGPAVLKISAWGARVLHDTGYKFTLVVNWAPKFTLETARAELERARAANPKKQLGTWGPLGLPSRLWEKLLPAAGIALTTQWAGVPGAALRALAAQITEGEFSVTGKSTFKEEFVTCGGVKLSEVDFKTFESRLVPGLHFAGEVLDIDGVTGGFNFQAAWTGGLLAGRAMGS